MHRSLSILCLLFVTLLSWGQVNLDFDYVVPEDVRFQDDLNIDVQITNSGTLDVSSSINFNFYIDTILPNSFPPTPNVVRVIDIDDAPLEPGESEAHDLDIDVNNSSDFVVSAKNIIIIWPRLADNDTLEVGNYSIHYVDVLEEDPSAQSTNTTGIYNTSNLVLHPNPSTGVVYLSEESLRLKNWDIEVFNAVGKKIKQRFLLENDGKINLKGLVPGLYIIRIKDKDSLEFYSGKVLLSN